MTTTRTTTTTTTGSPLWIDVFSSDPDRAADFYGTLFGWTAEGTGDEFGGYVNFSRDGAKVAGMMRNDGTPGTPDMWTVYLQTDDAARTVIDARTKGGVVLVEPTPVGPLGTMAVIADPGGANVGVWQPGEHPGFEGDIDVPGTPGWFELHTRSYDLDLAFYRDVFGWTTTTASDEPGFRYTTVHDAAGVMDAAPFPAEAPVGWNVYFRVADVATTIEQAVALGATVVLPAEDTPFGRLAQLLDPMGAPFKLIG